MERTFEEYIEHARQSGIGDFHVKTWKDGDGLQCSLVPMRGMEAADACRGLEFLIVGSSLIPIEDAERDNPAARAFKQCPECGSGNISVKHQDIDSAVRCTDCQWNVRVRYEE